MIPKKKLLFYVFLFIPYTAFANGVYVNQDSDLYFALIDIRNKNYDDAIVKLEPLVEKNDAEALFWYGYMKQSKFGRGRYGAYRWFEKAGELGNPYGMFKLSGTDITDDVCDTTGWDCDKGKLDLAIQRWIELAAEGDIRAEYFAEFYDRSAPSIWFDEVSGNNKERIRNACENGYCSPFRRLITTAINDKKHSREDWSDDYYQMIKKYSLIDPAIATYRAQYAYEGLGVTNRVDLLLDSLNKGYYKAGVALFSLSLNEKLIPVEDAYVYVKVAEMGNHTSGRSDFIIDNNLVEKDKFPALDLKARKIFENIKHQINFDEMDFMYMSRPDV